MRRIRLLMMVRRAQLHIRIGAATRTVRRTGAATARAAAIVRFDAVTANVGRRVATVVHAQLFEAFSVYIIACLFCNELLDHNYLFRHERRIDAVLTLALFVFQAFRFAPFRPTILEPHLRAEEGEEIACMLIIIMLSDV